MTNKLPEYLRIAKIHKDDPTLLESDGQYIINKLKPIKKDIVSMCSIFGAEESDVENLKKIELALNFYKQNGYN